MNSGTIQRLRAALALTRTGMKPRALVEAVRSDVVKVIDDSATRMTDEQRDELDGEARRLEADGIDAVILGADGYPEQLAQIAKAPPVLFVRGRSSLLRCRSVGMCGSRHVSDMGLGAARDCGAEVARHGLVVSSGYAKGVDTETHLAALREGGSTVVVLAEGILGFRVKRDFKQIGLDWDRVVVVSQFAPDSRWSVGNAMTRNAVIAGLAGALVVIEAGEKGGTLNAGLQALQMKRPVLALEFESQPTPEGNRALIQRGAIAVRSKGALHRALDAIESVSAAGGTVSAEQLALI